MASCYGCLIKMLRVRLSSGHEGFNGQRDSRRDVFSRSNASLFNQQLFKRLRVQRFAEQKSLYDVTLERAQILKLFFCLHALRDHSEIERMAQVDNGAHNRGVVRIFATLRNKRLVYLQRVDRKSFQVIEG